MEFLKLFQNHTEYDAFVSGGTMVRPNVSHCVSENEVHYNPIETRLIVKYNVTDANEPTLLYTYYTNSGFIGAAMFDKVEIDGVEVSIADLDAASGKTQLSVGEHTAKYTLKDPTFIGVEFDEQTEMPTRVGATFDGCSSITTIEIPNSVTSIGDYTFSDCYGLTSVTIPDSVTSIGESAFVHCSSLVSVTIGNSVTSIGENAFNGCTSLTSVAIPDSVTSIGGGAFGGCNSIIRLVYNAQATLTANIGFNDNTTITEVVLGDGVTSIGEGAFGGCDNLTSVTIGNSVMSIDNTAFCECSSLDENSRNAIRAINPSARFGGCSIV